MVSDTGEKRERRSSCYPGAFLRRKGTASRTGRAVQRSRRGMQEENPHSVRERRKRKSPKTILSGSVGRIARSRGSARSGIHLVAKIRGEMDTVRAHSMDRTFVHPKTGEPTTMATAGINAGRQEQPPLSPHVREEITFRKASVPATSAAVRCRSAPVEGRL